jgi:hypothetical protein
MDTSMFDLVLRGQRRLSQLLTDEHAMPSTLLRLLGLSLAGLGVHGLTLGLGAAYLRVASGSDVFGGSRPWLWMPLAIGGAFLGALCVCLPSFYFYTQLSGLDASFRLVTAQALRAQATTSVLLLGALPFYAAWLLFIAAVSPDFRQEVGPYLDPRVVLSLGMGLPFLVGVFGVWQVYRGFEDLIQILPITHVRRGNFLGRMVLCWGAVFTAVAGAGLWRLSEALSHRL